MNKKSEYGFTLIELMVTLAVAAIILGLGVPSFKEFIRSNAMTSKANIFVADLNFTRSEAIKRGNPATICKSNNQTSCTTAGGWEQGWIVFADPNNPGTVDAGETILRIGEGFNGSLTLRGNNNVDDRIFYSNTGFVVGSNGTLIFCDDRIKSFGTDKSKARAVIVSNTGRVRVVKGDDASVKVNSCTP
jgi:type IV fimbrial biogenesis protein FimT